MKATFTNKNPNLLYIFYCFFCKDKYIDRYLSISAIVHLIFTSEILSICFSSENKKVTFNESPFI